MSIRNNRRRILALAGLAAGVIAASNVVCAQIPCEYQVTIIAPEPCDVGSAPAIGLGISEDGNVVGYVGGCLGGPDRAFLWTPETGFNLLPTPPGTIRSWAFDITPDGAKIVGSFDLSGDGLANLSFLYDHETGKFTNLGTLPGGNWSEALAINGNGDVTGFWGNNAKGPLPLAFVWGGGEMIDISGDFGTPNSLGNDINAKGQVTGWMGTAPFIDSHAFVWDDGSAYPQNTPPKTKHYSCRLPVVVSEQSTKPLTARDLAVIVHTRFGLCQQLITHPVVFHYSADALCRLTIIRIE